MNNPSKDHGQKALSYSPFFPNVEPSGGEWDQKSKLAEVACPVSHFFQSIQRKIAARSIVNRYSRDLYGRPRIITGWMAIFYALAWPTVIGVTIGFALAISLALIHSSLPLKTQPAPSRTQIASTEASS